MISVLLARTEEHHFAFRSEDVQAVLQLPRLCSRPGDIALLEGWVNFHGELLPSISLARILGLSDEPPEVTDHLVLTRDRPQVAWRVRRVEGLTTVSWEQLHMLEHTAEPSPCYAAAMNLEGQPRHLINVAGLLMAEERERLDCAEAKRQARLHQLPRSPEPDGESDRSLQAGEHV